MNKTKEIIWQILLECGEKKRAELQQLVFQNGGIPLTEREFRQVVREMVMFDGYPIGTSPERGYFVIKTQKDFDQTSAGYISKIKGIAERLNYLKDNVNKMFNTKIQLELKF